MKTTFDLDGELIEIDTENDRVIAFQDMQGPAVMMYMPGYNEIIMIPVNYPQTHPGWYWNGDKEKPTFSPSLLTKSYRGQQDIRNHVFIRNGVIEFLSDCSHELAGKKGIELPRLCDWPEEMKLWEEEPELPVHHGSTGATTKEAAMAALGLDGLGD